MPETPFFLPTWKHIIGLSDGSLTPPLPSRRAGDGTKSASTLGAKEQTAETSPICIHLRSEQDGLFLLLVIPDSVLDLGLKSCALGLVEPFALCCPML